MGNRFAAILTLVLLQAGAALAQGERAIPSDAGFVVKTDWFDGSACEANPKNTFYFRVGKQVFAAASKNVVRARLKRLSTATSAPHGQITVHVPRRAGCKESPLDFFEVELTPGFVVLVETPQRTEGISLVTKYIQHLNKIGACQPTKQDPNLNLCSGSRTEAGRKITVFFMVISEGGGFLNSPVSGVPIHARCEDLLGPVLCMVSEEMENDVTVKAPINEKTLSSKEIRQLRSKIVDLVASQKVK